MTNDDKYAFVAVPKELRAILKELAESECRSIPKQIAFLVKQEVARKAAA